MMAPRAGWLVKLACQCIHGFTAFCAVHKRCAILLKVIVQLCLQLVSFGSVAGIVCSVDSCADGCNLCVGHVGYSGLLCNRLGVSSLHGSIMHYNLGSCTCFATFF